VFGNCLYKIFVKQRKPEDEPSETLAPVEKESSDLRKRHRRLQSEWDYPCQSGYEADVSAPMAKGGSYQNIRFSDQRDDYAYIVESPMDPTRSGQDSNDADLGDFFKRPIKIREIEWGTGTSMFDAFNPWTLYFRNPRVANRLANYHLLRCKLHLKLVINGNGFQYGRAIASYLPLAQFDTLSNNVGLIQETLVQASQQPHVFLDPTLSRGGEMLLPFFYYKNNLSIPDEDYNEMGTLTVRSINPLKHANGASDQVTVSVFAWAEDVSVNVLTSREATTLTPQSGTEVDEANAKGVVSGKATAVANIARSLGAAPTIGPFAMATATVAQGVAEAAKLLGYCNPAVTKAPEPVKPIFGSNMANVNVPSVVSKLSLDDKQELTIDPSIAGVGNHDPLDIATIASKESYLTTFNWALGTAPETLLWNARVDPVTWAMDVVAQGHHFPACAVAAMPFEFWTGTMNFRFQFVTSAFHKGRVKIVYDPNWLASNEYNTNYLEIVDISEKSDFTISVTNGQEYTLLTHHDPINDSVTQLYSDTAFTAKEEGNGVIGVYVVNELTTPNSSVDNDIEVNVYVSMGKDFEVFVPKETFKEFVFKPQSGMEIAESENTDEKDAPEQSMSTSLGLRYDDHRWANMVYTGEAIKSFRTILKRPSLFTQIGPYDTATTAMYFRMANFPYLRGNVTGAIHTTALGDPYTYCNTVMLHWVAYCFQGWRGSIRYRLITQGGTNTNNRASHLVERTRFQGYEQATFAPAPLVNAKGAALEATYSSPGTGRSRTQFPQGTLGMTYTHSFVNPTMEWEMPFYSRDRFCPGKIQDWTTASVANRRPIEGFELKSFVQGTNATKFGLYVSTGEDFQVYMWTGMPPMYFENAPPG